MISFVTGRDVKPARSAKRIIVTAKKVC